MRKEEGHTHTMSHREQRSRGVDWEVYSGSTVRLGQGSGLLKVGVDERGRLDEGVTEWCTDSLDMAAN